jgi:hypothetical protein
MATKDSVGDATGIKEIVDHISKGVETMLKSKETVQSWQNSLKKYVYISLDRTCSSHDLNFPSCSEN